MSFIPKCILLALLLTNQALGAGNVLWKSPAQVVVDDKARISTLDDHELQLVPDAGGPALWTAEVAGLSSFSDYSLACTASDLVILHESLRVIARSAQTGETVWSIPKDENQSSTCSPKHGKVLIGPDAQGVYNAYAIESGLPVWKANPGLAKSSVSLAENDEGFSFSYWVNEDSVDWRTVQIAAETGKESVRWQCPDGRQLPLFLLDHVYCSDFSGQVSRLDKATAAVLWSKKIGEGLPGINALSEDLLLAQADQPDHGLLTALRSDTAEVLWSYAYSGGYPRILPFSAQGFFLMFKDPNQGSTRSVAMNAAGKVLWEKDFALQTSKDALYHSRSESLERLAADTGASLWSYSSQDPIVGILDTIGGELLLAVGRYPKQAVVALDKEKGSLLWQSELAFDLEASRGGLSSSVKRVGGYLYLWHPSGFAVIEAP